MRQNGGLPGPPPVVPLPESLATQGPYVRLSCPGLARARNVSRHWGPPRACHRAPCCEKGGPSGPKESSGWSPRFPPVRAGTNEGQRSHARRPPLGQPQLNVPRERSRPRGRPLQPRFPKEHHHRRAADDSLCGTRPQSNVVVNLEMEREEGGGLGLGHRISAAGQHRKASYCLRGLRLGHGQDSELRQIHNRVSDSDSLDLRRGYATSCPQTSK